MPKVIVSGRGGSGKSTLVALMAKRLAERGPVLVVDADESNLGLGAMLGLEPPGQTILENLGGKPAVRENLLASLRGGDGERVEIFADGLAIDSLPPEASRKKGHLTFVRVGKIDHSMEGCACPMGAVARAFLKKLTVGDDEWVLVDTEAGVEHFGRGILEGADCVVFIVEPSHEGAILADKASRLAGEVGKPFYAVLNKVDDDTEPVLRSRLSKNDLVVLGVIPYDQRIARANLEGDSLEGMPLEAELDRILASLASIGH